MPYLVLALGLVLSLIGLASIISGYPIIQIERGWTSVIAGATLLAGGAITASLGLLLRAVGALRSERPFARPEVPTAPNSFPVTVPRQVEPQFVEPAMTMPEPLPESPALDTLDFGVPDQAVRGKTPIPADQLADLSIEDVPDTGSPSTQGDDIHLHDALHTAADEASVPDPVGHIEVAEIEHPAIEPSHEPAPGDWLDKSLADFDRDNADVMSHAPTEPALPPIPDPEPQDPKSDDPPAAEAAVIGRYEADGTSYVMYADGSIEAQSPAGIYRFNSMAELKAFIEG